jgi:dipeptidyl aminopeptidase/acylaminoacyl peptidase
MGIRQEQKLLVVDLTTGATSDDVVSFDKPGATSSFTLSADGRRVAFVRSDDDTLKDAFVADLGGSVTQLTDLNPWVRDYDFGEVRTVTWTSFDGLEIEGLLRLPAGYEEGDRVPLLLEIHGGPMGAWMHTLNAYASIDWSMYLAQRGYATLLPNPRGSSGRGAKFLLGIVDNYGEPDWQDLMAGVDKVIELGIADPDKLVVGGWSGGGYLTNRTITHTSRFRAAVSGAGISNWVSFQGTADCRSAFDRYFGVTEQDPDNHWKYSPIRYIKNATTPTLILYGEQDARVPPSQGFELYEGLKAVGVETQLVLYPREGHGIAERVHQLDLLERVIEWYESHLGRVEARSDELAAAVA